MGFTNEDIFAPGSTQNTEDLALSQDGIPQTHCGKVSDVQHISDFSHQDYQVRSATQLHVDLL